MSNPPVGPGDKIPDAVLETPDGTPMRLSELVEDGPALLTFYKADCGASRAAVPRVPRFHDAYPDLGVWVISQDDPAATREFLDEGDIDVRVLVDAPSFDGSRRFGFDAVPALYLVDRDGRVLDSLVGWDRDRFNELSGRAAEALGVEYRELVGGDEGPAFRPG